MLSEGLLEEELGVLMKPVPHLVNLLLGQQPRIVDVDGATPASSSHVREAVEA
jgi:hypothetical protein